MGRDKQPSGDPIRDIPAYLRVFYSHVGARFYLVFVLGILASLAEGAGILMLLPLLQSVGGIESQAMGAVGGALDRGLEWLGLGGSTLAVLGFILVFFLLKGFFLFAAQAYSVWLEIQLLRKIKVGLYDSYGHMRLQYYVSQHAGHFVNVMAAQANGFVNTFKAMLGVGKALVMTVVYLVIATAIAWSFGLMALVLGVVFVAAFSRLNTKVRHLSRRNSSEASIYVKLMIQSLHSFKYLVSTAGTGRVRQGVVATLERILTRQTKIGIAHAFTGAVREPFAVVAMVGILALQLLWLEQPLGPIIVSILLFYRALGSVAKLQSGWQGALGTMGSVEIVQDEMDRQAREREVDGTVDVGPLSRGIELRDVYFSYSDELKDVLAGIDLEIPARQTVAIVGESGSGKSTLVDVLTLMLKPRQGQVLIDGVRGEIVRLESWRSQIGFVSQESVVFDDTIANNICLWDGDIDSDPDLYARVIEAARQAHLQSVVASLPAGFHTMVGDRGVRLSGGQRQRLFVARELFKRPRLLILDEATSALDSESERAIQDSIDALKGKMTVVMVAHRLATIRNADRIFVLDRGRVVEQGDFESLQKDPESRFARLVSLQQL